MRLIDWLYPSFTAHKHQKGHTVPKQVSPLDDDDDITKSTRKKVLWSKILLSKNCTVWEHSLSSQVWTKCPTRPDTQGAPQEAALCTPTQCVYEIVQIRMTDNKIVKEERLPKVIKFCNTGNNLDNCRVLNAKSGQLLLAKCPTTSFWTKDYGPFPNCMEWMQLQSVAGPTKVPEEEQHTV